MSPFLREALRYAAKPRFSLIILVGQTVMLPMALYGEYATLLVTAAITILVSATVDYFTDDEGDDQ